MRRLFVFVYATLVTTMICFAQSEESNRLFAEGVELYNAENYSDAIKLFEQVNLIDSLELDSTNNRRVYGKMWIASCWFKLNDIEKASVYDNNHYHLQPIDRRLTAETDSLGYMAIEAFKSGDLNTAKVTLEDMLQRERSLLGEDSFWTIGTLSNLAWVYANMGDTDKAIGIMYRAYELCRMWYRDDFDFSQVCIAMYNIHFNAGRFDGCKEWMDKAEAETIKHHGVESDQYMNIIMGKIGYHISLQNWKQVGKDVDAGLKLYERRFGEKSEQVMVYLNTIANFYEKANRPKDSKRYREMVIANQTDDSMELRRMAALAKLKQISEQTSSLWELRNASKKLHELIRDLEHETDTVLRYAYWSAVAGNYLLDKTSPYKFEYTDYERAKNELKNANYCASLGYMYVMAHNHDNLKFIQSDTLLHILNDINPKLLSMFAPGSYESAKYRLDAMLPYIIQHQVSYGRRLAREGLAALRVIIESPSNVALLGKIESDIARCLKTFTEISRTHKRYGASDNYSRDSINYALGKIEASLHEMNCRIKMKTGKSYSSDFYQYKSIMLLYCNDTIAARNFAQELLDKIAQDKGKTSNDYISFGRNFTNLFSKGSQEGVVFYNELLGLAEETDSFWHPYILEDYYEFIGDKDALLQHKISRLQLDKEDDMLKACDLYKNAGKPNKACEIRLQVLDNYASSKKRFSTKKITEAETLLRLASSMDDFTQLEATINKLLDKLEKQNKPGFVYYLVAAMYDNSKSKNEAYNTFLCDLALQQETNRKAFKEDNSLLLHLHLFKHDNYSQYEQHLKDLNHAIETSAGNSIDKAEFIFTKAMFVNNKWDLRDKAEEGLIDAINYFESDEQLLKTDEYKTLLITQFKQLDAKKDAERLIALSEKINSVTTSMNILDKYDDKCGFATTKINDWFYPHSVRLYYRSHFSHVPIDLQKLAEAFEATNQTEQLQPMLCRLFRKELDDVRNSLMDTYDSWSYVSQKAEDLMSRTMEYSARYPDNDTMRSLAYDAAMLCKGMMLAAEGALMTLLAESDNASLTKQYNKYLALKKEVDEADKNEQDCEPKREEMSNMHKELISGAKKLGSFTASLTAKSVDVSKRLNKDEAAIEFSTSMNDSLKTYYALVMTSASTAPIAIKLCTERDLLTIEDPYTTTEIHKLLWQPLEHALNGINRIYFSPTGLLHHIAIEYVPTGEDKRIDERYEMFRLSNTRELLAQKQRAHLPEKAVLYGGIIYDSEDEYATDDYYLKRGIGNDICYLPGTNQEITNISTEMAGKNVQTTIYKGLDATEQTVKELSGTNTTILHFATHGFYDQGEKSSKTSEDEDLLHSGLYMAGAACTIHGETTRPADEDGILTAKDIASLNLGHTDLVVLSACQTALGAVTGEGVFGLQRGFKKAGVKSIMMSLWPVDDDATQILMTSFYKELLEKKSKREAFINAQRHLRTIDDGRYNSPEYWAAFILLDALD